MTAKGNGAVNQMGMGSREDFPPTRILAISRGLSNIFLHRRQNSEKAEENSFRAWRKLWKGASIRAFFLLIQRSTQLTEIEQTLALIVTCLPFVRAVPSRIGASAGRVFGLLLSQSRNF
jgi:hypothetical protein